MRPAGDIRQALRQAAERLAQQQDGVTWRELAEAAQVGYTAARATVDNMARAGELPVIGQAKRAHSRRWMTLYGAPQPGSTGRPGGWTHGATSGLDALQVAVQGWRRT